LSNPDPSDLESFFQYLYGDETGYIYCATKSPSTYEWNQFFFSWPNESGKAYKFIQQVRSSAEVYMAPALFTAPGDSHKEFVKGASVVWVEFDGNVPTDLQGVPDPTCRIRSSGEQNEHWYWKLDRVLAADELERINRALTYKFGADSSGWDANQVLRPPGTFNHKKKRETALLLMAGDSIRLAPDLFQGLPEPPPKQEAPVPTEIPEVQKVIATYPLDDSFQDLFVKGVSASGDRSDALMALGYRCAELGMMAEEILAIVMNADERWGKFKDRPDRMVRLMEIVTRAKQKHPVGLPSATIPDITVKLEWQWEGFLQRGGYMLTSGPSGVGKTQFALNASAHFVLGRPFLDRPVAPARVGFFSLEMGVVDLKVFLISQSGAYTEDEMNTLEEGFKLFPLGEPLYLSKDSVRAEVEQIVGDLQLTGIVVDSIGSATDEEVSDEKFKKFFHWNDQFRQRTGAFTWYIHHMRKASGDNKKPNKLSDVYGSQYITSYATSVCCLWPGSVSNTVQLLPLKVRLAAAPAPITMQRNSLLNFTRLDVPQDQLGPSTDEKPDPQASKGFLEGQHTSIGGPLAGSYGGVISEQKGQQEEEDEVTIDLGMT
jgi:hypothetical protein